MGNDGAQHFYEFMVASLLTAESLLLAVFGNMLSIYATYKSSQGDGNAPPIAGIMATGSKILIGLTVLIAGAALWCLFSLPTEQGISLGLVWILAAIIVGLVVPAIYIVSKMK